MAGILEELEEFEVPLLAVLSLVVLAAGFLIYQTIPIPMLIGQVSTTGASTMTGMTHDSNSLDAQAIVNEVTPPEGITIDAVWGNVVQDMIKAGALDPNKLANLLASKYGQQITPEMYKILTTPNLNEKITINSNNAVFMMYVFGMMAKHNDNPIIHNSPWTIPNIFSEAGRDGWGDVNLISLTSDQQSLAQYIADNAYRPCCGQPTSKPDCTHGFSLLGLIELMASQGFDKSEIYKASLAFNSYWFPSNYIFDALYFKTAENKDWNQVDAEKVMGRDYSSLSGAMAVQSYLKSAGII
ncbi:MAG TPA: hypothetical protein VJH34_04160 [archaeon]|nr:hypothetical protein [archaeon]